MTKRIILIALASFVVVSCGTAKKAQEANQQQYSNNGGYYPQGQPGNYQQVQMGVQQNQVQSGYQQQYQTQLGPDVAGYEEIKKSPIEELSLAVGTGEIRAYGQAESGSEQLALNAARAQATAALQEKIEVYVRAGLDRYTQETGVNGEYSLDEMTRNQIITAVKGIVNGATILDSRKMFNPTTRRYKYEVCVKYDRAGILSTMQQQSSRISANERQFEADMQHAWDALDAKNNGAPVATQQETH